MSQAGTAGAPADIPAVSVVIPTRNRWGKLARLGLSSALSQRGVDFEVIVVDDHSDSPAPEAELTRDPRVRLIRLSEWGGVAVARNAGIEQARGEWIAFLDDDDLWAPDKLALLVGGARRAGADFGYSSVLDVEHDLRPVALVEAIPAPELRSMLRYSNGIHAIASNIVVRRTLLERIGGFDERFSTAADWEIVQRLIRNGRPFSLSTPLVAYRPSSWLLDDEPGHRADLRRLESKYEDVSVDWNAYEHWIARSFRRAGRRREAAAQYLAIAWRFRDPNSLLRVPTVILAPGRIGRLVRRNRRPPAPDWLLAQPRE